MDWILVMLFLFLIFNTAFLCYVYEIMERFHNLKFRLTDLESEIEEVREHVVSLMEN